ncbi:MAG: IS5 family transposase [Candidatus Endonucleobacter bathymodioli]|uniref:IS5 family transposase n=1 Tax=Candidatus Endonucleibacter bathymodioli TaxID=539814 RepID=A0AA90SRV8_9GAMM|nr:IS5 family transposase [Candidatus Endonucleobacter bathymodioli]
MQNETTRFCVPWAAFDAIIKPHYPKSGRIGGQSIGLTTMLRIYLMQQWFQLSDPMMKDDRYEIESMRRFAKLELCEDRLPDETTILNFRRLIEKHQLSATIFADINQYLVAKGIKVSQGSMVDATIIQAPSSTKNKDKKRDPDMRSTRKNNQYYFGFKIHSNVIHSATVTPANEADVNELPKLLRKDDKIVFADAGYTSDTYKREARSLGMSWKVNDKRKPKKNMSSSQKKQNRKNSQIRARVEHCFRVIKCQFGYKKASYKGLVKNAVQVLTLLGLANLYMLRGPLGG